MPVDYISVLEELLFFRGIGETYTAHTLSSEGIDTINALLVENGVEVVVPLLAPFGKTVGLYPALSGDPVKARAEHNKTAAEFVEQVGGRYGLPTSEGFAYCSFLIQGDTEEAVMGKLTIAKKVVLQMIRVWGGYAASWPPAKPCSLDELAERVNLPSPF